MKKLNKFNEVSSYEQSATQREIHSAIHKSRSELFGCPLEMVAIAIADCLDTNELDALITSLQDKYALKIAGSKVADQTVEDSTCDDCHVRGTNIHQSWCVKAE